MSNLFLNIWWHIWYVFVLVKTDSNYYTNRKYSYKKFQSVLGKGAWKQLMFHKTSYQKGIKLVAYFECKSMIAISQERAFNILSKMV